MSEAKNPSAESMTAAVPSDAPNWNHVPFEVGCARCGHDLRGRTESSCPACELKFDWADAVPIERLTCLQCGYHLYGLEGTRCPECGSDFTWDEALAEYHRRRVSLFEYRWRDRPIRSLLHTWIGAMRPGGFWRSISIHDPPLVAPLLGQVAIALALVSVEFPVAVGLLNWLVSEMMSGFPMDLAGILWSLQRLPKQILRAFANPGFYLIPPLVVGVWFAMSLGSLLLFQQSMRLCRIKATHVLRVCFLSLTPGPLFAIPTLSVFGILFFSILRPAGFVDRTGITPLILFLCFVAHSIWALRQGYKHYLRMRHAFGVALSSQVIAILGVVLLFVGYSVLMRSV